MSVANEAPYAAARHHAEQYLKIAKKAAGKVAKGQEVVWLRQPDEVFENLWAALPWIVGHADVEPQLYRSAMTLSLNFWLDSLNRVKEGRAWVAALLTAPVATKRTAARASMLHDAAVLDWFSGDLPAACAQFEESLSINRELGDRAGIAEMLDHLASVLYDQGEDATAGRHFEECLAILRELGNEREMVRPLIGLAKVAYRQGEDSGALCEQALTLSRRRQDRRTHAWTCRELAEVARLHHDQASAAALDRESLAVFQSLGDSKGMACGLASLAALVATSQPAHAARLLGAAEACYVTGAGDSMPLSQIGFERAARSARVQLDDATWETARTEGRTMTLEQAIAYALEQVS